MLKVVYVMMDAQMNFAKRHLFMSAVLSPLISEFESSEQEAKYTAWLQEKVFVSLTDTQNVIPHDEVMAEMDAIIEAAESGRR